MPREPKTAPATLPTIPAESLEQFGIGSMTAGVINGVTRAFRKALF